jgi:hypothetical protein
MLEHHDIQPLRNPVDQANARASAIEQLEHGMLLESEVTDLAVYLLGALAQIEILTQMADPMARRFGAGAGHKYPDLATAGYGHLWQGPGLNDWHPQLLEGIRQHLRGMERSHHRGACCDYIRNRLHEGPAGIGALELRFEEGAPKHKPVLQGQKTTQLQQARSEIRALHEIPEAERESTLAAIDAARPRPQP